MLRSESQKLPALERTGKGEGLMLCPVPTPSVLINKRQAKVANYWRSPYNEVYRIAKSASPSKPTLPDVTSPRQRASPPAPSTPLPLPASHAKEEKNSKPLVSFAEERENKGDNPLQIRGILSRSGGENGSDGGKKKPARRVQFADRYEKLCELGKKYGGRAPKAELATETCQGEVVDDVTLPFTREGLNALQGEVGGTREKTDLQEEEGTSEDFHCLSRSSSLPDLVSAPLSGSMSPFKLSPLSNEADGVQPRAAKAESPAKSSRLESPVRIIRNPYSRHSLFPSRLIRAKTSMTSQKPYVIYGFDLSGEDDGHPTGRSTSLSTLQRAKTFLSVKGRSGVKAGGSIPRRPLASLCDASKTLQIIQWLRDVNMTQAKEGKCTASLAPANPYDHAS